VWVQTTAGSLEAVFESKDVGRVSSDFAQGLGGKAEETALFLPVMRQVIALPQESGRR
jgi:hypothetical protein